MRTALTGFELMRTALTYGPKVCNEDKFHFQIFMGFEMGWMKDLNWHLFKK